MNIMISSNDWQILRVLVRNKNKPTLGSKLRITPTRKTKDGQFLLDFLKKGLLSTKDEGPPFLRKYVLTERGLNAAEYGEFSINSFAEIT